MRIKDYPKATAPASDDYVIIDGGGGTRAIAATALKGPGFTIGPNSIYDMIEAGGKNTLGLRAVTLKQNRFADYNDTVRTAITNGTYNNIYPGTKIGVWTVLGIRVPVTAATRTMTAHENILVGQIKPMEHDSSGAVKVLNSQSWFRTLNRDTNKFFGLPYVTSYDMYGLTSLSTYSKILSSLRCIPIEWLGGHRVQRDNSGSSPYEYVLPIIQSGYRIKDVFGADADNVKTLISYHSSPRHVYHVATGEMTVDNNTIRDSHTIVTAVIRGDT